MVGFHDAGIVTAARWRLQGMQASQTAQIRNRTPSHGAGACLQIANQPPESHRWRMLVSTESGYQSDIDTDLTISCGDLISQLWEVASRNTRSEHGTQQTSVARA